MTTAKFNSLPRAEKRVAIFKDIVKTLSSRKKHYSVRTGNYVVVENTLASAFASDTNVQKILPKIEDRCEVCAMGACFLSHIRLANKVKWEAFGVAWDIAAVESGTIISTLRPYFSEKQLREIEMAFEGRGTSTLFATNSAQETAGYKWRWTIPSNTSRLIAICKNGIRNKGNFKLMQLPRKAGQ